METFIVSKVESEVSIVEREPMWDGNTTIALNCNSTMFG